MLWASRMSSPPRLGGRYALAITWLFRCGGGQSAFSEDLGATGAGFTGEDRVRVGFKVAQLRGGQIRVEYVHACDRA